MYSNMYSNNNYSLLNYNNEETHNLSPSTPGQGPEGIIGPLPTPIYTNLQIEDYIRFFKSVVIVLLTGAVHNASATAKWRGQIYSSILPSVTFSPHIADDPPITRDL